VKCRVRILVRRARHVACEVRSVECECLGATVCVGLGGFALGIVQCNTWSVDWTVQSDERKVSMVFGIF
jgi:hypothetical protein